MVGRVGVSGPVSGPVSVLGLVANNGRMSADPVPDSRTEPTSRPVPAPRPVPTVAGGADPGSGTGSGAVQVQAPVPGLLHGSGDAPAQATAPVRAPVPVPGCRGQRLPVGPELAAGPAVPPAPVQWDVADPDTGSGSGWMSATGHEPVRPMSDIGTMQHGAIVGIDHGADTGIGTCAGADARDGPDRPYIGMGIPTHRGIGPEKWPIHEKGGWLTTPITMPDTGADAGSKADPDTGTGVGAGVIDTDEPTQNT